jgi:hypothetical protein
MRLRQNICTAKRLQQAQAGVFQNKETFIQRVGQSEGEMDREQAPQSRPSSPRALRLSQPAWLDESAFSEHCSRPSTSELFIYFAIFNDSLDDSP